MDESSLNSRLAAGEFRVEAPVRLVHAPEERFALHGLGAGLLVGSFTSGQVRHGILHAIIMVGIATAAYPLSV